MTCDLKGKKGLIAGIANAESIAYGCARACHAAGAELLVAYGHPKAEPHVQPLLAEIGSPPAMLCDVTDEGQMQALFEQARSRWGKLDFLVHSIAFAPKQDLQGRLIDCSSAGFRTAMEVSCFSFVRMAKLAEPLMRDGGCLLTMSYYGAEKVVARYNVMGPVKAALESVARYLAAELGPQGTGYTRCRPGRCTPALLPASPSSTGCWSRLPSAPRRGAWCPSTMSARRQPSWQARRPPP
jgi:enoyl-[acyl-carrier protein] reductase I